MEENKVKISLCSLFNESEEVVVKLRINEIDDFPNHPYKVLENEKMQDMVESVKQYGVTQPVIIRRKENGRYEMISGHRRKKASILAGLKEINGIIKDLTDDEATILMVDSNESQRDDISFSEKALPSKQ